MTHTTYSLSQIPNLVKKEIIPLLKKHSIFTLTGPLGAGKTTLIKELFKQCGISQVITSPTFTYVNTYLNAKNRPFHHFDLYRIEHIDDFIAAGLDEYLNEKNAICIIEWPGVIAPLLQGSNTKNRVCTITIDYDTSNLNHRFLKISS